MESSSEHDGQLTPEQLTWGAQVSLAAAMTLWASLPDGEKRELIDEVLEQFDHAHIWAYAVLFVESLGFAVEPLDATPEQQLAESDLAQYEPESDANKGLLYNPNSGADTHTPQLHVNTGFYL